MRTPESLSEFRPTTTVHDYDLGDGASFRVTANHFHPLRLGREPFDFAQRTAKRLARARWQRSHAIITYAKHLQSVATDVYRGRGWPSLDTQAREDVEAVLADMYVDDAFNTSKSALRDEIIASLTAQSVAA